MHPIAPIDSDRSISELWDGDLTDLESDDKASDASADPEWQHFFEDPAREARLAEREARVRKSKLDWITHQSRHWSLGEGDRCTTGFKGRSDLTASCPPLSSDCTPAQRLQTLRDHGYTILEVK